MTLESSPAYPLLPSADRASIAAGDIKFDASQHDAGNASQMRGGDQQTMRDAEFWCRFGFEPTSRCDGTGTLQTILPRDTIALSVPVERKNDLIDALGAIGNRGYFRTAAANIEFAFYRAEGGVLEVLRSTLPAGVTIQGHGDTVPLPSLAKWAPKADTAKSLSELAFIENADLTPAVSTEAVPEPMDPVSKSNPMLRFSLQGSASAFEDYAKRTKPLLGNVCVSGQATMWYAPPNGGKTLIALSLVVDAIKEQRIAAGNVFFVNADDSGSGLAAKLRIMDDLGAHTLAPGFNDFKASDLILLLHRMADRKEAKGVLVIIDTVKKFASLMDKRESSAFAEACRQFVLNGGTVLGLAHTAKNRNSDGKLRYAGTTDLLDDFDSGYLLNPVDGKNDTAERVVEFECIKRRANCADRAAYSYAGEADLSYDERLASVQPVDLDRVDEFQRIAVQQNDSEIIAIVQECIAAGQNTKMILAREVATRSRISGRAAMSLIERYTGEDPQQHRWQFCVKARGAKVFELLAPDEITPPTD